MSFEPSSGTVPPLGDVPITVVFVADAEKPRNFNVVAAVRRKPSPLSLNVKGEGYALHETLQLESMVPGEEKPARLLAAPSKNAVDLGRVLVNETRARAASPSSTTETSGLTLRGISGETRACSSRPSSAPWVKGNGSRANCRTRPRVRNRCPTIR